MYRTISAVSTNEGMLTYQGAFFTDAVAPAMTAEAVTRRAVAFHPFAVSALIVTVTAQTVLFPVTVITLVSAGQTVSEHRHYTMIGTDLATESTYAIFPFEVIALLVTYRA
jgi:hypothetical protein